MNMEITSVSKKAEKLSRTPAAVFVITSEDIRNSGARNIPDLLRMVPGMDVAQINANTWAISARGLNEEFSDKLLVLIDGRSVYTPTFGGVLWETVTMPLEDIERIEVIRGPGGAIWGANAVNGVINIITKKASETRGGMIVAGGGTLEHGFATARYGAPLGANADGRAYVQFENHGHLSGIPGQSGNDQWDAVRGGFRVDNSPSKRDTLTLQGDMYNGQESQDVLALATQASTPERGTISGGYLQTIWERKYSERADSSLQISFDRYVRSLPFTDHRNTLDATYQYHFAWGSRQDIVTGAEYRFTNHMSNSATVTYSAADNTRQLFGSFVQDEIEIVPDRLYFTIGVKMEHNDYTGFGAMPDARIDWEATKHDMFWAAVSRAERTPTSGDTSDHVDGGEVPGPGGIPVHLVVNGNPNFLDETLLAYQAGYRGVHCFQALRRRLDFLQHLPAPENVRAKLICVSAGPAAAVPGDAALWQRNLWRDTRARIIRQLEGNIALDAESRIRVRIFSHAFERGQRRHHAVAHCAGRQPAAFCATAIACDTDARIRVECLGLFCRPATGTFGSVLYARRYRAHLAHGRARIVQRSGTKSGTGSSRRDFQRNGFDSTGLRKAQRLRKNRLAVLNAPEARILPGFAYYRGQNVAIFVEKCSELITAISCNFPQGAGP